MQLENETVVSPELMKQLRKEGLATGYQPVPDDLVSKAKQLLGNRHLASMDADMKRRLRNRNKKLRKRGVPGYRR